MRRDELVRALQAQPHDTDVQFEICGFRLDLVRVDFDNNEAVITLGTSTTNIEDIAIHASQSADWRILSEHWAHDNTGKRFLT